jgi:hypothetical protein
MKWMQSILLAIFLFCGFGVVKAQEGSEPPAGAKTLGTVTRGNTTIFFEGADPRDLDLARLHTWQQFADAHPGVASALAYKPKLISDAGYLSRHPELSAFFQAHPDVRNAMIENPGNFVAIPPRPGE